jgi:16S rRNA (guanine527-N7)-methyltransferase
LSAGSLQVLEQLRRELGEANRSSNMTRVLEFGDYWTKHIADSLAIGLLLPELATRALSVADIGCGAGFPLLPLAWAFPGLRLVGIDPKRRRCGFVNESCRKFGWAHCRAVALQAREGSGDPELAGAFDLVVSRAFADCGKVLKECRGLVRGEGGRIAVYKTPGTLEAEWPDLEREARKLGYAATASEKIELPLAAGDRQFAILTRQSRSPS